jgi:hydrogenase assembly chaperone HypC/HupF
MCVTAPGLVVARDGDEVLVEIDGRIRRASGLLVENLLPGEHCLVGLGLVLERLSEAQAAALAADLRRAGGSGMGAVSGRRRFKLGKGVTT